jgi:Copper amine oxidase, enzyme domain
MTLARSLTAKLISVSLAVVLPTAFAATIDRRPVAPNDAFENEHRRMVEEGEQASRTKQPSPPPVSPPNNGIEQIAIDESQTSGNLSKKDLQQLDRDTSRVLPSTPPPCPFIKGMKTASLVKVFPDVAWHICVTDMGMKGLWVGPVHLKRTPSSPWMWVLYQAGLAEIFVPYHQTNFRAYDLRWTTKLDQVTSQDAGANGSLITLTNEVVPTVVAEVRERGLGWLCKQLTVATRRAEELVVWGVSDGGNYDNIVQFGFRDDGSMSFRMGNTGFNWPTSPREAHTHNALWRIDMDLNGFAGDSASWLRHREPRPGTTLQALDDKLPFYVEGARKWDASQFTSLLIEDTAVNAFGHNLGYEFTTLRPGTCGWRIASQAAIGVWNRPRQCCRQGLPFERGTRFQRAGSSSGEPTLEQLAQELWSVIIGSGALGWR